MNNSRLKGQLRVLMTIVTENQLDHIYGADTAQQWQEKNEKAIDECFDAILEMIKDERELGKHILQNGGDRE